MRITGILHAGLLVFGIYAQSQGLFLQGKFFCELLMIYLLQTTKSQLQIHFGK